MFKLYTNIMLMNIFSNFDPMWFNLCYKNSMVIMLMPMLLLSPFWSNFNMMLMNMFKLMSFIMMQLMKTKMKSMKLMSLLTSSMFIYFIYMNIIGMIPYMFSATSQIILTFSIGFPMWLLLIISSTMFSTKYFIAHLLPDSAPMWLNPFLTIIELISISVRPITLSFRLAANMTAGHVVLSLMSSFSISLMMKTFTMYMMMSMMYMLFEISICIIQAYIFCLLISLYSNDHS